MAAGGGDGGEAGRRRRLAELGGGKDGNGFDMNGFVMAARAAGWAPGEIVGELQRMMEAAAEVEPDNVVRLHVNAPEVKPEDSGGSGPPAGGYDGRPVIHLAPGETANNCREAIAALAADTAARPLDGIYVRDRVLFRPVHVAELGEAAATKHGVQRSPEALVLVPVELAWLMTRLADAAAFTKYDARRNQVVVADPPQRLAAAVLAGAPWPGLPVLRGVVQAPTLRADGSILDVAGYDTGSGLLYNPGPETFPAVPMEPTPDQVEAAKALIDQTFSTFPFNDQAARSVAIAACLTALLRRNLASAPAFAFDAPDPGSGKTLLGQVPAWITTGTDAHLRTIEENETEEKKSAFAALLDNPSVIILDNVDRTRTLKSASLCAILTSSKFVGRLLGFSKTVAVPTNVTCIITGNNLRLSTDIRRRVLTCRIVPRVEHPEQRRFYGPPLREWVLARRRDLVVALLTLARAYLAAGEPRPDLPEFGSFGQWSRLVRFPLIHVGYADPCATLSVTEKGDNGRRVLGALLRAWHEVFVDQPVMAKEVVARATHPTPTPTLREALAALKGRDNKEVDARKLGTYCRDHRECAVGGLLLEEVGEYQGWTLWRVVAALS